MRDTDQVVNSQQYLPDEVVEQFDWEGGKSHQQAKAVTNQSDLQQIDETVRETDKVGNSRQYLPLEVGKQFDWEGGNSKQPVKALTNQSELQQMDQIVIVTDKVSDQSSNQHEDRYQRAADLRQILPRQRQQR